MCDSMRNTTVVRWFFGCCILPTKPSCARFECHFLGEECRVVLLGFSPHYLAGGRLPCLHRKTPTPRFKSVLCIYIYHIYIHISYIHISYILYIHISYIHISYIHISYIHISYIHISYIHISYIHISYIHISYIISSNFPSSQLLPPAIFQGTTSASRGGTRRRRTVRAASEGEGPWRIWGFGDAL